MGKYQPIKIAGMSTGLVQSREEFILPNDAYPVLENAFVWRERIKRKKGTNLLGRLTRLFSTAPNGLAIDGSGNGNIWTALGITPSIESILPGAVSIGYNSNQYTDPAADGTLVGTPSGSGTINYITGDVHFTPGVPAGTINSIYIASNLPVVGILNREINSTNDEQTIFFDTKYAYQFASGKFSEYPSSVPTTWNGLDYNLFWGTNYWVSKDNIKIFWVTNFNLGNPATPRPADPIRYTDGTVWINFFPAINAAGTLFLNQALALLPFRGRLLAFNTFEGNGIDMNALGYSGTQYRQRIRWSALGTPFADVSSIVTSVNPDSWKDDIRGQGNFLDIPTNQDIISVGFVRDNLVIYCERSTWQLRYTGRSIQPFQIERVNAELGTESTFSSVQFDTSLVGFGDKAIVECDSFKSAPIDIKIPDLVFEIENQNNGNDRVVGIRDFQQRLAYWAYPFSEGSGYIVKFPNKRLVYNYENDSWAIFQDSFTYFGSFQDRGARTWAQSTFSWSSANFQWGFAPALFPYIVAGNQQGFVSILDQKTDNDPSLWISNITAGTGNVVVITCKDHNLSTSSFSNPANGNVVQLTNLTGDYSYLNDLVVGITRITNDTFSIYTYSDDTESFSEPVDFVAGTYNGSGYVLLRDGFRVKSKKFNFLDEGENIQIGYIDVLMNTTSSGAITMNVYADYNDTQPINTYPENANDVTDQPDTFFNSVIPTKLPSYGTATPLNNGSTKMWQRIYCPTRASFLTTELTLSNAQLNGDEQTEDVQVDCQIMWVRKAGKQLPIGI